MVIEGHVTHTVSRVAFMLWSLFTRFITVSSVADFHAPPQPRVPTVCFAASNHCQGRPHLQCPKVACKYHCQEDGCPVGTHVAAFADAKVKQNAHTYAAVTALMEL